MEYVDRPGRLPGTADRRQIARRERKPKESELWPAFQTTRRLRGGFCSSTPAAGGRQFAWARFLNDPPEGSNTASSNCWRLNCPSANGIGIGRNGLPIWTPDGQEIRGCRIDSDKPEAKAAATLGPFLTDFTTRRIDVKPATKEVWSQVVRNLLKHFGADRDLAGVTEADAEDFKMFLVGQKLAPTTVHKRLQFARHVLPRSEETKTDRR